MAITVDAGAGISSSATTSDESCPGAADGIIIVNVTDGSGNYEYTLDGGTAQSSNTFGSVAAGPHDISITDLTTGCTCLLYTSPSPRDATLSRMPSSA